MLGLVLESSGSITFLPKPGVSWKVALVSLGSSVSASVVVGGVIAGDILLIEVVDSVDSVKSVESTGASGVIITGSLAAGGSGTTTSGVDPGNDRLAKSSIWVSTFSSSSLV